MDQLQEKVFEKYIEKKPDKLFKRFLVTNRHLLGLLLGGGFAFLRHRKEIKAKKKFRYTFLKIFLWFHYPFLNKKLVNQTFAVQLIRRLEMLGATYIKLGQILSLREDILPPHITEELKKLLDTLPALPFDRFVEIVEEQWKQPYHKIFKSIDEHPLGSASIAQAHKGILRTGEMVVIKLLKPGTRELIVTDSKIIRFIGSIMEWFVPQIQPKNMFSEFCEYTNREVDFRLEVENGELFTANFLKHPDVIFPKMYREFSTSDVIVMEFFKGYKPDAKLAEILSEEEKEKVVDLGVMSIIQMLYSDGFFHAGLHPGNLIVLKEGNNIKCGFIDLGMVGRFEEDTRKNMLYYYSSLVGGDPNASARYLSLVAKTTKDSDLEGFRREFCQVANRWQRSPNFSDFSLGQLIFESVVLGAKYRLYFPLELVLMVKAIVTFEGVGNVILPNLNIAKVSKKHIRKFILSEVNPIDFFKSQLLNAPELFDVLSRSPMVLMEGFRKLEKGMMEKKEKNQLVSLKHVIFGGFCILGGAIMAAAGIPWQGFVPLFVVGGLIAMKS